jgi:hypothetical protein
VRTNKKPIKINLLGTQLEHIRLLGTLGIALAFMTTASLGASGTGCSSIKETGK